MFFNISHQSYEPTETKPINIVDPSDMIIKSWSNFLSFSSELDELSLIHNITRFGFTHNSRTEDKLHMGFHFIEVDNRVFGFCGESLDDKYLNKNSPIFFHKVVELRPDILVSENFKRFGSSNNSYITTLEAPVPVDLKGFAYEDSDKLLITKAGRGNIDLFLSYTVDGKNYHLVTQVNQSIEQAAKTIAREILLEQRIQNLKK